MVLPPLLIWVQRSFGEVYHHQSCIIITAFLHRAWFETLLVAHPSSGDAGPGVGMYRMLLVMLLSAPISHISGTLAHGHRGYNFVMPLAGGFQFIVSQGFGWMLYGVCLAFVVIGAMNQVLALLPMCTHVCTRICTCTRSRAKTRDARQRAYTCAQGLI